MSQPSDAGHDPDDSGIEVVLGSPSYFGEFLRKLRVNRASQQEWVRTAGIDPSVLSRIERGEQLPPPRHLLVQWAHAWELPAADIVDLMVAAGYLPVIRGPLVEEDRKVLMGAMRELFYPEAFHSQAA